MDYSATYLYEMNLMLLQTAEDGELSEEELVERLSPLGSLVAAACSRLFTAIGAWFAQPGEPVDEAAMYWTFPPVC